MFGCRSTVHSYGFETISHFVLVSFFLLFFSFQAAGTQEGGGVEMGVALNTFEDCGMFRFRGWLLLL